MERTHEELRELVAPYVLGAVDAEEAAQVRSHVLSCEECMAEAENLAAAASALAVFADPVSLPTGFEDGVIGRIRAESAPDLEPVKRSRWRVLAPAFGAAALIVALAVLGLSLIDARNDLSRERDVIATLLQSNEGIELEGEGTARMVPTDGGGVFAAAGLEEAPDDHIYQVWLMDDACVEGQPDCTPVSAGTFDVEDGVGLLEVDRSLEGFTASAVTLEEGAGSQKGPTTDPVLTSF
jgi:hypothetical protein